MTTRETVYLSKKGIKELKKTIAHIEHSITREQAILRDMDKTSSHEERFMRIEQLAKIDALEVQLREKRAQLDNAKLLPRRRDAFKVALGSVVDLVDSNGRLVRYTLVESIEANPSDGRISVDSPLGRTLLGRTINEVVEWSVGLRVNNLQLVRIS